MLAFSARSQQLEVHLERAKADKALMAIEAKLADDVALIAAPQANEQ